MEAVGGSAWTDGMGLSKARRQTVNRINLVFIGESPAVCSPVVMKYPVFGTVMGWCAAPVAWFLALEQLCPEALGCA